MHGRMLCMMRYLYLIVACARHLSQAFWPHWIRLSDSTDSCQGARVRNSAFFVCTARSTPDCSCRACINGGAVTMH